MVFETDSHFLIGKLHINSGKPCQDHALSGVLEGGTAFAIIADGCSTGRHTDMGARILTFATTKAIQLYLKGVQIFDGDLTPEIVAVHQRTVIQWQEVLLNLSEMDLLATCAHVFVSPEGGYIHLQGDGVFAYKLKSGEIFMTRLDWENNAPCYPAYAVDNYHSYIKAQGGDTSATALISRSWKIDPEGVRKELPQVEISLGEGIRGSTKTFSADELARIEFIAVFSDGVTQIDNLEWQDAVAQLLAFKTTKGEFATRRLIRVVKDAEKLGKGPLDDIACAVVKISEPQPRKQC